MINFPEAYVVVPIDTTLDLCCVMDNKLCVNVDYLSI